MNNKVFKHIKLLLYLLFAAGAAAFVALVVLSYMYPQPSPEFIGSVGAAKGVDLLLWLCFVVLAAATLSAVGFSVANIVKDPVQGRYSFITVTAVALLFGMCWLFASDNPIPKTTGGFFDNYTALKWTDTTLYAGYIMIGIAIAVIIWFEVRESLMRRSNKKEHDAEG